MMLDDEGDDVTTYIAKATREDRFFHNFKCLHHNVEGTTAVI